MATIHRSNSSYHHESNSILFASYANQLPLHLFSLFDYYFIHAILYKYQQIIYKKGSIRREWRYRNPPPISHFINQYFHCLSFSMALILIINKQTNHPSNREFRLKIKYLSQNVPSRYKSSKTMKRIFATIHVNVDKRTTGEGMTKSGMATTHIINLVNGMSHYIPTHPITCL